MPGAWSNEFGNSITLPTGAGPNDPRIVIGGDVPPELAASGFRNAIIFYLYDNLGNYQGYVFLASDSPAGGGSSVVMGVNPFKGGVLLGPTVFDLWAPGLGSNNVVYEEFFPYLNTASFFNAPLYPGFRPTGQTDITQYTYLDGGGWNVTTANGAHQGVDRTTNGLKFTNNGAETDYPELAFSGVEWPGRQYMFEGALWANANTTSSGNNALVVNVRADANVGGGGTLIGSTRIGPITNTVVTGIQYGFRIPYRPNPLNPPTALRNYFVSVQAITNNIDIRSFPTDENHIMMNDRGAYTQ